MDYICKKDHHPPDCWNWAETYFQGVRRFWTGHTQHRDPPTDTLMARAVDTNTSTQDASQLSDVPGAMDLEGLRDAADEHLSAAKVEQYLDRAEESE